MEVREGVRPMPDGRSTRAQHPRRLMTVQFTRQVARDTSVDCPERDCAEFEIDALANQQPVQLPPTEAQWTDTMRRFFCRRSERVLDTDRVSGFCSLRQTKTNVYYNCGSQEAGLVKHRLHKMNSREYVVNVVKRIKDKKATYDQMFLSFCADRRTPTHPQMHPHPRTDST